MEAAHFPVVLPAGVVFCMGSDVALGTDAADSSVSMPCARGHSGVGISPLPGRSWEVLPVT